MKRDDDMLMNHELLNITQIESEIFGKAKPISGKVNEFVNIVDEFVDEISSEKHRELFVTMVRFIHPFMNILCDRKAKSVKICDLNSLLNISDFVIDTNFLDPLVKLNMLHIVQKEGNEYCVINPKVAYIRTVLPRAIVQLFGDNNGFNIQKPKNIKSILNFKKEKSLEKYLTENLHLIEKGMLLIKTQFEVDGGYIDILARDRKGTKCVIELKVTPDDRGLVFQSVYYPSQFEEKVRMITICPNYSPRLYRALSLLENVEIKQYSIRENSLIVEDFK